MWTSRAFADLLDDPLPVDHDAGAPFLGMLRSISEFHFGGAYSRLASAISRNKSVVGTWFAAGAAPGWKAACEVSFVFKIPLRDMLIGDEAAVKFSTVGALPLSATERYLRPRRLPKARDLSFFRMFLKEVADGAHPALASMNAVAEKLAIDASALRKLLPEESGALTAILAARRAEIRLRMQSRRAVELEAAIRQVGDDLARNAGPLTRRNVDLKLRHLGFQLRHEDSVPVRKRVAAAKEEAERILSGNP